MKSWLSEDQKFAIGATIIFMAAAIILSALYGCASVFDAPVEPLYQRKVLDYDHWKPSDMQLCIVAHERRPWLMIDEVRNCKGWIPI